MGLYCDLAAAAEETEPSLLCNQRRDGAYAQGCIGTVTHTHTHCHLLAHTHTLVACFISATEWSATADRAILDAPPNNLRPPCHVLFLPSMLSSQLPHRAGYGIMGWSERRARGQASGRAGGAEFFVGGVYSSLPSHPRPPPYQFHGAAVSQRSHAPCEPCGAI